jgi:hypothetical protein
MSMNAETPKERPFAERRSTTLLATTQRAFWPLIRLLLHRGIGYPALAEALKSVFIRVAQAEFPLLGKRETDSRISLLTGIHRRDVKRLRDAARARSGATANDRDAGPKTIPPATAEEISLSARVIAIWTGLPQYLDARGEPRPLPRLARKGGEHSFESLVRSISTDIRPRALLDEWLRRRAVTVDKEDRVCLNLDAFMAQKDLDEKAFYFAQNIYDHLSAVAHNLTGTQPPFLERCVFYGALTPESIAELTELARKEGMKALQSVNRRALELKARDAGNPAARSRMNFGLYFFSTAGRPNPEVEPASPSDDEKPNA